ncbi:MAG: tetratricopeptide repeat protein, partial [Maribacter stanieri]
NLSGAPSHIDTKILMGRVNSWQGNHEKAAEILQECIAINPNYIDSYAALFDVYYWSDKLREGLELIDKVQENSSSANEIADKISRARTIARNAGIKVHQLEKKEPLNTVASVK